jgi:hypothetical protein
MLLLARKAGQSVGNHRGGRFLVLQCSKNTKREARASVAPGEDEAGRPGPDTAKGLHFGPCSGQEAAFLACRLSR